MKESKKAFTEPECEIVELLVVDVITTSGEEDDWWMPEI